MRTAKNIGWMAVGALVALAVGALVALAVGVIDHGMNMRRGLMD